MTHRFHRLWSVVVLAAPGAAYALGLGEIHLDSGLNQPLAAQIELIGASAEELTQLRASVASRETFLRYGVDRPAFLSSIQFKVGQDSAGRPVLIVRSADAVTEPFVTFLVDVNWPRGKLTREYTLLLDPPVYDAPAAAAGSTASNPPPVVQAPQSGAASAPKAAPIVREAPPTGRPAAAEAPALSGNSYTVVPNDTLSGIARRVGAGSNAELNRMMIGIFRANPHAFDGNINRLRRGASLSIPAAAELGALSAAEADHAVREQMTEWRGAAASSGAAPTASASGAAKGARLKLVMPGDAGSGAGSDALKSKVQGLEQELAETKRLLDLKNAELARLQQAGGKGKPAATPVEAAKPGVTPKPVEAAKPAVPAETAKPAEVAVADGAKPAPAETPVKKPRPVHKPVPPVEAPGLLDSLMGFLPMIGGGLLLIVGAIFGLRALRKRRAAQVSDALGALDAEDSYDRHADDPATAIFAPRGADSHGDRGHDEASGGIDPASTISSETSINLEHADPLAEADFHMAYGLYDQAADIVKLAMEREPERRDLRLKLLEVYFVWSNKDAFLDVARGLARDRDHAPAGEWDKVAIMGRQIAPDEALFAGAGGRSGGGGAVDLDLAPDGHTDGPGIDLEFLGDDEPAHGDDVDLDLHKALGGQDALADTGESLAVKEHHLDFDLDATQERQGGATLEPTQERPAVSLEHTDTIDITGLPPAPDAGRSGETMREKLKPTDFAALANAGDQTAELALDDLDFEIEKLNATSMQLSPIDHTAIAGQTATMAAIGGEPTRIAPRPAALAAGTDATRIAARSAPTVADEATRIAPRPTMDPEGTAALPELHSGDTGDIDFDLEQLAATLNTAQEIHAPSKAHDDVDFDLSEDSLSHDAFASNGATAQIDASELAMHDLEPVTLSEVGTKIDLARAYMDMGDPDGARSILEEVLHEGSASQRQEAQRLIGGLPG